MKFKKDYQPKSIFTDVFPNISGNSVNGLSEAVRRLFSGIQRIAKAMANCRMLLSPIIDNLPNFVSNSHRIRRVVAAIQRLHGTNSVLKNGG